jgi:transcriptional regulator with XRE-family HTH domain
VTGLPPVRRRLLGAALRGYRESMGYGLADAARILDCDRSKVSRIETGQRGISAQDLGKLLDEYGVPRPEQAALAAIAHRGRDGGWWQRYRDVLSDTGQDLAMMEALATEILGFAAQLIPELLQTEDYARAVAGADLACAGDEQRHRVVEARLIRQAVVLGDRRARLHAVVAEGAVRQMVGGPEVMRRQLRRLANLGDEEGSPVGDVTVQVLPFRAGAHPAAEAGSVTMLSFAGVPGLGVVHIGGLNGGATLDSPADLARYARALEVLRATALTPAESVRLLRDMARALPRGRGR